MDVSLIGQMDWTAVGTIALALATFVLVIETYQTMKDTRKQSKIEKKKKELRDQEEAYSKFMGLKVSTGLVFQHRSQIAAKEWQATYSQETVNKVHDVWLSATLQNTYEAEREYSRHTKYLWEAIGLIQTRFENTEELTNLINNLVKIQKEYGENLDKAPPEGLDQKQLGDWAKQLIDKYYSFDQDKLNPALGNLLKYLQNEINKGRSELTSLEEAKHWYQFGK